MAYTLVSLRGGSPEAGGSPGTTGGPTGTVRTEGATPPVGTPAPTRPALPPDRVYRGRGAKVVRLDLPSGYAHIAAITHRGDSNFVIWAVDADGTDLDLIVNEIGGYTGVRPLDFVVHPSALKIEADGSWRVVVRVLQRAPLWTGRMSGRGPGVLRVEPGATDRLPTVTFTHAGEGNFVVYAYGQAQELLVNEIGPYSGETLLPAGTVAVEIHADGPWTFRRS